MKVREPNASKSPTQNQIEFHQMMMDKKIALQQAKNAQLASDDRRIIVTTAIVAIACLLDIAVITLGLCIAGKNKDTFEKDMASKGYTQTQCYGSETILWTKDEPENKTKGPQREILEGDVGSLLPTPR